MLVLNLLNYRFTCQDPGCQGCYAPEAPALTSGALTGNNQSGRLSTGMYLYQPLIHRPQLCCWLPALLLASFSRKQKHRYPGANV